MKLTKAERDLLEQFNDATPVPAAFEEVQCLTARHLLRLAGEENGVYYWLLSHDGVVLVDAYENERREKEEQKAQQEQREAARLKEREQDRADERARYRGANRTTILAAVLSAVLNFVIGVLVEHFGDVYDAVVSLFH